MNDQLKSIGSIGLDDKKLQNWTTSANSCNNENFGEEEDSNSLNNEKDIIHELQVENTLEDNDLSEVSGGTGGQAGSSQSEQEPVTPVVLGTQVRSVCSTDQTCTE